MAKESKYKSGLSKTKVSFWAKLKTLFTGKVDENFFEELEMVLVSADMSISAVSEIVENLRDYSINEGIKDTEKLKAKLKSEIVDILNENGVLEIEYPAVFMIVGVNGVGKTTTIGKLVNYFVEKKKEVVVAAADTFRAAAQEQLSLWAKKSSVRIINSEQGSDPSSVVFDAVASAKAKKTDVLIIDTAGRLHNKTNLMEELKKMNRVLEREYKEANVYKFIVIDAVTGQNALQQVEAFDEAVELDGVVLTKLDGTAKGGIAVTLSKEYSLPICFVGLGEGIDDLQEFDSKEFVDAIFE
ncbi:MAG: signal recognition particle-docking protein FtsY [Clostridia bacterium]